MSDNKTTCFYERRLSIQYINYIGTDDGYEHYQPSVSLQNLLEKLVIALFRVSLPEEAKIFEDFSNRDYITGLRKDVLNRGSTNFDTSLLWRGKVYTPEHKVLLNCVFYMPMHLYSSYHLYRVHGHVSESKNVVFIDFGCGPLTSGIAFWAASGQRNITYIGIDSSEHMLNKAAEINTEGPFDDSDEPFYKNFHRGRNFNNLPAYLRGIETGNPEDTLILFNFSYVLAPMTFQGDINELINMLLSVIQANLGYKIAMVYQNISGGDENWKKLKNGVINAFPHINFTTQNRMESIRVKYNRLMQGTQHSYDVSYDCFYNW